MQDGAICQATVEPQWLGNNMLHHMTVYSIAVTELEKTESPVSGNTSVAAQVQNTSISKYLGF